MFLLALATLSTVVNALDVTQPSSSIWWVAKSDNVLAWTCSDTTFPDFTVLIANSDPKVLVSPMAIISIQQNFQCSIVVSQDVANQPAGTGWTIQLANPINITDVYATSQPFEIKPLGSAYPSQATPSANASSGSASPTSGGTTKPTSGAVSTQGLGLALVAGAVAGAVGMML